MTYIDSTVSAAHAEVEGESVSEQLLGELSQVHRSAKARDIFEKITSIKIGSKADLVSLLQRVKSGEYSLTPALRDARLQRYVKRAGLDYLN